MTRWTVSLIPLLLVSSATAGCLFFGGGDDLEPVLAPEWQVGDKWVYERSGPMGEALVYERKVNAVYLHGPNMVYEVKSGLRSHPLQDYHLYRTDDLRYVGGDLRDGSKLVKRVSADEAVLFHYVFPLEPGARVERDGVLNQQVGGSTQRDEVRVTAVVAEPGELVLGERVYDVVPYEIKVEFLSTPFDDVAVLQAWWSPSVGQNVLTILEEGGRTIRSELVYFERVQPRSGPPAYDLLDPLRSRLLERGFTASPGQSGWQRFLFHVEDPLRVGMSVTLPLESDSPSDRLDVVSLRPLGYTRAGIADQLTDLATGGLFLHVSATDEDGNLVHQHAAQGIGNDAVVLQPGQVYELIVATNVGEVNVRVEHTEEHQSFPPVSEGEVEVLSGRHAHVQQALGPGPQSFSDSLDVSVPNPDGERIEGVVYVVDHGEEDEVFEWEARREVHLAVDQWAWTDDEELYAYYFGYIPRDGFAVRTGYDYQATVSVSGQVDFEMGVLLLKLLPP